MVVETPGNGVGMWGEYEELGGIRARIVVSGTQGTG